MVAVFEMVRPDIFVDLYIFDASVADTVKDFDAGMDLKNLQELFQKGTAAKDPSRMLVWAGTGVGIMKSVKPATVSHSMD